MCILCSRCTLWAGLKVNTAVYIQLIHSYEHGEISFATKTFTHRFTT